MTNTIYFIDRQALTISKLEVVSKEPTSNYHIVKAKDGTHAKVFGTDIAHDFHEAREKLYLKISMEMQLKYQRYQKKLERVISLTEEDVIDES